MAFAIIIFLCYNLTIEQMPVVIDGGNKKKLGVT